MLSAEGAVLVELQTVRGILLVLHGVVVSLLALRAPQGDLDARAGLCHLFGTSLLMVQPEWAVVMGRIGEKNRRIPLIQPDPANWAHQPFGRVRIRWDPANLPPCVPFGVRVLCVKHRKNAHNKKALCTGMVTIPQKKRRRQAVFPLFFVKMAGNWKEIVKKIETKYPADVAEALTIIGKTKEKEKETSEEYKGAVKLIEAKVGNLESNLHIEIDMERIEDRSKALSYIGIEIAEALKYIPAPIDEIEEIQAEQDIMDKIETTKVEPVKNNVAAIETKEPAPVFAGAETSGDNLIAEAVSGSNEEVTENNFFEETRFEAKPTLWQRIKNSKFVQTIKYILSIKVVLEYPALPEGRGEY